MYAVGKVGSLLYTVAGPFHPFGGAVDIVVVQQQDGSFKSSPWYVRFGKFQGVLKAREKVVNIAVNGVEAGFHMYLDSNGEAHFLRDADPNIEEGVFVVSPASSGDEREVLMQDAQLRKSKSTSCDISTMEANVGDSKVLARTISRRSTILERMFGRKSIKDDAHAVDRASSLERAEIAAELLDTKWSTNLSRNSKARGSNDEPSSSHVTDAGNGNQVETTQMVLPDCSFDHKKAMGSNCDSNFASLHTGRRSSGDDNEHCVQKTSVKEEIVEIYERKTCDLTDGIISTTDHPGSESLSNDLGTEKSIDGSIDTQDEPLGNSEDVTGREMYKKEVLSHGIFEIHAVDTDITNGKSEAISQFVTADLDGIDQNFTHTYSPTYSTTDVSSERHDVSDGITSMTDRPGSESLPNDLGADKSINESIDIQGELRCNSEDVTGREIHRKEFLFHGIFEIHDIETDITNGKSEAISQFVAVDSDGVDHSFTHTYSQTYSTTDLSSERHDVSDGITSTTDQPGSEYLSNDLGTDRIINESIDSQGELQGNSEDVTGRDIHTKEVLSHGIFEIHAIETDITNGKSEVISQFVAVDSDGVDQNFTHTNSLTYSTTDLSSERHDASLIASGQDACQEKVVIISSLETVVSSYDVSGILANKICDAAGISLADGVQFEECSRVSSEKIEQVAFEERPLSYHGASSNKEDKHNLDVRDQEVPVFGDSSSQVSQANVPDKDISVDTIANDHIMCSAHDSDMDISVDTIANDHSTHSAHDLACQYDLVFPGASSSVVGILSYVQKNYPGDVTKNSTVENKTCNGEHDLSVIQTSRIEDESTECIAQTANFPNKVDDGISPIISDFSSLSRVELENTKQEDDNRSSSASGAEIGLVPEESRDEAEAVVSFSEFVDDIQFQFSDAGSFSDRKTVDDVIDNKAAGAGVHDESNGAADEQGGDDTDLENKLENHSDLSRPESSLSIPGSELHPGDNNLEAKSLPNLPSHIHDLERSDSFQISRTLQYNGENNEFDPLESTDSGFPEQEPEGTGDSKENSSPPEPINNPVPDDKHADDLEVDSFNPFVELSLCRHLLSEGMGVDAAFKAFDAEKITLEKFRAMKQSLIRNNKLVVRIAGRYFPWDVAAPVVLGMVSFREEQIFEPQGMIKVERVEPSTAQGSSWRIWPFGFRRTRTINTVQPVCESTVESSLPVPVKESSEEKNKPSPKRMARKVQSLTPTSEELASLDLREGRNVVTFTFSTAMLGRQQVDAHIYLWKWNTRIVISDVDGTITKSDVLGQFMPMVGVDWSQNGVAHLFSAIKENGYQLLFLSARSISQAHLTRQFLFNLKQDGKALPDGPVVISPDGLFPSLYREVIRRAPHEFKISCLAAIKALFPPDSHPFYAGFGNRDTDELSYLNVGIPMGKIFIINPKGEVAVNHRVDTKSYTSLHALVNGMFPPISSSSSEQEDYNTWNYWKMPLPTVDI